MLKSLFRGPKAKPVSSTVAYTLRNELTLHGKEFTQTQYLTEHYVLNHVQGKLLLFRADTEERYLVDRAARTLKKLDLSPQLQQANQMRSVIGDVELVRTGEEEEVEGRSCRRLTLKLEQPQIVISGDFHVASIPGVERTALARERALDEAMQPFRMGLAPDEVLVRSRTMVLAAGAEQNQSLRLASLEQGIEELDEFDAILSYKTTA